MNVAKKTILITGANRGIGWALANEALKRGAQKVYAGTRGSLRVPHERVAPITVDVTSDSQIQRAAESVALAVFDGVRTGVVKALERQFTAFVPQVATNLG